MDTTVKKKTVFPKEACLENHFLVLVDGGLNALLNRFHLETLIKA